jgi:hypothetical protein
MEASQGRKAICSQREGKTCKEINREWTDMEIATSVFSCDHLGFVSLLLVLFWGT